MIKSLTKLELLNKGVLFADTIEEAFDIYDYAILEGTKLQMEKFLWMAFRLNEEEAYVDFYYPVLTKDQQRTFLSGLSKDEKQSFDQMETADGHIYYPLKKENLTFLAEITAREWLFSTFYFNKQKALVWGNYKMRYPLFCKEKEVLLQYIKIAKTCGLEIE